MKSLPSPLDVAYCIATVDAGNVSLAARHLGITQSALSQSLNKLERDLGVQVLVRERTGTTLTPSGRRILSELKQYLAAGAEIHERLKAASHSPSGHFTLGCHPSVGVYALPELFLKLSRSAPEIQLTLFHGNSRQVQDWVVRGELDLGFVINATPVQDLVIKKMGTDEVSIWRKKGLRAETSPLFCDPALVQTQTLLKRWKTPPARIVHTASLEVIRALVLSGAGLGIVPSRVMGSDASVERVPGSPRYLDELSLVFRPSLLKLKAAQLLVRLSLSAT